MDYIEIAGYKSIKKMRLDLAPVNILIGGNGSGKSNFISFFDFLNRLYNRKLNDYIALNGGENKILHKGKKNTDRLSFKMEFKQGLTGYAAELQSGEDGFVFLTEDLINQGNSKNISQSNSESRIKLTDHCQAPFAPSFLRGLRKYHFHDTSPASPFAGYSHTENDIYYLYENGMNVAAFIFHIHQTNPIVYNRIIKNIQSIAPYFSDFYFSTNEGNYVRLQWTDKYSEVVFGAHDLSDGTLRFIALSALFLQPDLADILIVDEPELGLHPAAIAKLASMIKSASARGSQVVIATQSADLISYFQPEDIITVDQLNGESVFNRLNSDTLQQWMEDYTLDDLWKRSVFSGGQPNYQL